MHRRHERTLPVVLTAVVLACALLVSLVLSLALGTERISVTAVVDVISHRMLGQVGSDPTADVIVWELRVPRAILAAVVGAGLTLAGAAMQTLIRNPLADPYLLGVSSGAGVGATAVITFGLFASWGIWALTGGALLGALAASLAVFAVASAQGGLTPLRLVLTGVVLSSAFSAIASFLVFASRDSRAAQSVLFWLLGNLSGATWLKVWAPLVVVALSAVALMAFSGWMDALAAGPDTAASLGVPVIGMRRVLFVGLAVLVGVLVAVSGGIGFVGLVLPHLTRRLVGARHRQMLPVALLGGALFLLWVDVLARVLFRPLEIPLGVVTGVVGAPVFLLLMGRADYRFGGSR